MLISKDGKSFIKNKKSNNDSKWYNIKDNSELAKKFEKFYPNHKIILDEKGKIKDIINELNDEDAIEKKIKFIEVELKKIDDLGVNRHLENEIEASKTFDIIYYTTRELIEKKIQLREERKKLVKLLKDLRDEDE